jgi:hypothetical protein
MRPSIAYASARLAVALAAASLLLPSAALGAGIGGFSVRPGEVNPANPATRAYFVQTVAPGGSFTAHVVVAVAGSQAVDLRVYRVDGLTGTTSGAVYSDRRDRVRRAGRWVRPTVSRVLVAPHSQRAIAFTVHVPRSATPGDHLAGLAFEGAHPRRSAGKFSVTEVIRAVVGIEIEVPGPSRQQIRLKGMALQALPGTRIPSVVVSLGDSGGKLCKPYLSVSLAGAGSRQLKVQRQLDTILPGDYIPFPLPWPRPLAAGSYTANAQASRCGRTATMHAVVRLGGRLPGTTANPYPRSAAVAPHGGMPFWLLPLVAIGGVAAGVLLTRRRVRPRTGGVGPLLDP